MKNLILLRCKRHCGNFKFQSEDEWEKVTDKAVIKFFARQVKSKKFDLLYVVCMDCVIKENGGLLWKN